MPTPGVEALARAITSLAHGKCCWEPAIDAGDILAALSPSDRLAIAGITEERLATLRKALAIGAISYDGDGWFAKDAGYDYDDAEATLTAAREILVSLATPVTPEGGEW